MLHSICFIVVTGDPFAVWSWDNSRSIMTPSAAMVFRSMPSVLPPLKLTGPCGSGLVRAISFFRILRGQSLTNSTSIITRPIPQGWISLFRPRYWLTGRVLSAGFTSPQITVFVHDRKLYLRCSRTLIQMIQTKVNVEHRTSNIEHRMKEQMPRMPKLKTKNYKFKNPNDK